MNFTVESSEDGAAESYEVWPKEDMMVASEGSARTLSEIKPGNINTIIRHMQIHAAGSANPLSETKMGNIL